GGTMAKERLERIKQHLNTLRLPRHLLALLGIALGCALVFFFVGDAYLDDAADRSERQIVNDDYSTRTGPLTMDGELRQTLTLNSGRLYGVNLLVSTYGRVPQGTLHLRLLDQYGDLVARNDTDMSTLLDETFHRFLFNDHLEVENPGLYHLVITLSPATNEDRLAFYRSEGPAESYIAEGEDAPSYDLAAFVLLQDGRTVDGTLALQYVVEYSGGFIYTAYTLFAVGLSLFLLGLYLAVFVVGASAHKTFVYCCLVLGIASMFLIPPRAAPDEYTHIATAYRYSNQLLSPEWNLTGRRMLVRGGDEMMLHNYDESSISVYAYRKLYEGLFEASPNNANPTEIRVRTAATYPVPYLLPALGVTLARLFGLGRVGLLMLGRLFNLLFYTAVVSRAVKHIPIGRAMLFVAGLLPMGLQLAGSFSPDAFTIALSFYFIAACLDCALVREAVGPRQLVPLGLAAVLLAPAKVVYLLVLPLVLLIPAAKYASRRAALLSRCALLGAALVLWGLFSLGSITSDAGANDTVAYPPDAASEAGEAGFEADGPSPDDFMIVDGEVLRIRPNGDSYQRFTPGYILTHLPKTLRLLARSAWEQGALWLQGLLGGRLGEVIAVDITVSWLFVIALLGVLLCAALPDVKDTLVLAGRQRLFLLGLAAAVAVLLVGASLLWTPANYQTLFGMQGRYLLPVLPLALLALRGENLRFIRPMRRPLAFAGVCLTLLCQLDAFTKILQL
ncbi:DUF2142 domain-containing protein, partial [Ruminococcaceae bacterium OttesenSCG-928-D13]|nr:DUF2142 domain-containing protein [Ruminococcaceae bacterium OttesenSCG-928-D13]